MMNFGMDLQACIDLIEKVNFIIRLISYSKLI
jgi:hypothetical protein